MRYYTTYGPGSRPDDGALRAAWQPDSKRWGLGLGLGFKGQWRGPGAGAGAAGEDGLGWPQQWALGSQGRRGALVTTGSSQQAAGSDRRAAK